VIEQIRKWLKRGDNATACLVLFVPRGRRANDPVRTVYAFLPAACRKSAEVRLLEEKPSAATKAAHSKPGKAAARSVVLFAHPLESHSGFAVNAVNGRDEDALTVEWWNESGYQVQALVAHVCHGCRILNRESWRAIFPNWVSYTVDIHALLVEKRDRQIWALIAKAIVDATQEYDSVVGLKERICASYLEAMEDLSESNMERDIVHMLHFQKAMDGIMSSDESYYE